MYRLLKKVMVLLLVEFILVQENVNIICIYKYIIL